MKTPLFIIATLFLHVFCQAQDLIERSGSELNKDDTPYFSSYIGSDRDYFYTLRIDKNIAGLYKGNYSVDRIEKSSLNYVKRVATTSGDTRTDGMPIAMMVKNKIYVFVKFQNRSAKTCEYVMDIISTDAPEKAAERRVLASFPTDESLWYQTSFFHMLSPDSSKVGVIARFKAESTYYVYDAGDFKELSRKKLANVKDKVQTMDYKTDNAGNLYYAQLDLKTFSVNKVPVDGGNVMTCNFKRTQYMSNVSYSFDPKQDQIYVHTMYYEVNKQPKAESYSNIGIFVAKLDKKTMQSGGEKYYLFDALILDRILCGHSDKGFIFRAYQTDILFPDNGALLFTAEQIGGGSVQRGTNPGSMYDMSSKIYYEDNEIVVAGLSQNLGLTWMKLIPRNNTYTNITNQTESSIASSRLFDGKKLAYYFIEHPKAEIKQLDYSSINLCETPLSKTYPGSNVVEYTIDSSGRIDKRVLFTNKKEWLIPELYDAGLGNGKRLVRFRKGDKEFFKVITLH